MDYKEKYEQAIEALRSLFAEQAIKHCDRVNIKDITNIFSELKESEDERIRKALIKLVKKAGEEYENVIDGVSIENAIAWLEKQGEKLPAGFYYVNSEGKKFYSDTFKYGDVILHVEKQGEQKPVDKTEPKFHEGDWAVSNLDGKARQISEVHFDEYNSYYVVDRGFVNLEEYDRLHHLWSIKDAKAGDVLYSPCCKLLWIYKDGNSCYIGNNLNYNENCVVVNSPICIPTDAIPATKEQRDTLMKAMTDAGYTFDFEKKELKKIIEKQIKKNLQDNSFRRMFEQNPAWSEEDELHLTNAILAAEKEWGTNSYTANWLKSLKERVLSKQEWNEEDEDYINDLIKYFSQNYKLKNTKKDIVIWLKSLRPQSTWKPSDKQMKALKEACDEHWEPDGLDPLYTLYQDLKKLREE